MLQCCLYMFEILSRNYINFQPPVPVDPWDGIKDATTIHNDCPQRNIYTRSPDITGDEDCLYLNVYTPKVSNNQNNADNRQGFKTPKYWQENISSDLSENHTDFFLIFIIKSCMTVISKMQYSDIYEKTKSLCL